MTRKVSGLSGHAAVPGKKLTRQHPVIPPIKEGEELREVLSQLAGAADPGHIEREATTVMT